MRIHSPPAVIAFAAGGNAGNQDMVARLEAGTGRADLINDAHAFMAKNAARRATRHIPFQDMKIGSANRGPGDLHDGVAGSLDDGFWPIFQSLETGTMIDKGFHPADPFDVAATVAGFSVRALTPINLSGGCQAGNSLDG
jgi:hypothetical protein